jgi:hypothetical protein
MASLAFGVKKPLRFAMMINNVVCSFAQPLVASFRLHVHHPLTGAPLNNAR